MSELPEMTKEQASRKYYHMRIMAYIGVITMSAMGLLLVPYLIITGNGIPEQAVNILESVGWFWTLLVVGGYFGFTSIRDGFGKK